MAPRVSRRRFIQAAGTAGLAAALTGCPQPIPDGPVTVFRRSARGRRVSKAAKKHAANHLYSTMQAALFDVAHPGDNCKIVTVTISRNRFNRWFTNNRTSVDLRFVVF